MSFPIIGVVGGGQLARMMAPAAVELGLELTVLAESEQACAVAAVRSAPVGDYRDLDTLREFARGVDVLTFDHEHVPVEHLLALQAEGVSIHPGPAALLHAQDKLVMRSAVERLGLPNPLWAEVSTEADLLAFGERAGWPLVLKTPRGGYDGKGVMILRTPAELPQAAAWFQSMGSLLAEALVPYTRELSAMVARSASGEVRAWPLVESIQVDGVCDEVIAPAPDLDPEQVLLIQQTAIRLATELDVTGAMAVELFETPGIGIGFVINELAMRPHNSGHWSMDGSLTGQFEQHLRAVAGLPLGGTTPVAKVTVMKNILGGRNEDLYSAYPAALAAEPGVKVHHYGKSVRPGRKIGHVNALSAEGDDAASVRRRASRAASILRDGADVPNEPQTTTQEPS
ncbi:5-(carboxyamino)imidazole ribonucleotide synthase [Psychromicrobium xiongbiense]|uniref:5-(carboxyamino)imidazole ribonucleotide synthase n=1 Tax=Psychromicrobium xiongbiense TaxID=3051184 RepID=UPI0025553B79|nr:5-(carboxyamino)imidazole ribonucleotide synthase [Psychromicrobium sp. YIM S02556]